MREDTESKIPMIKIKNKLEFINILNFYDHEEKQKFHNWKIYHMNRHIYVYYIYIMYH